MQIPSYSEIADNSKQQPFNLDLIQSQLDLVRELIALQSRDVDDELKELFQSFNSIGGKMLRPACVLLSGLACGSVTDQHIQIAAILEMIHNATLLHDDVIDEGQLRRGEPTVNRLHGNEVAVLVGDFMLCRVFEMCITLDRDVTKIIAQTASTICRGELQQVSHRENLKLTEEQFFEIIGEKSAVFFESCCRLGALAAKADKNEITALSNFGYHLGMAFQITDDLLDIIADKEDTKKTTGLDIDKNELTVTTIHLLREHNTDEVLRLLHNRNITEHKKELTDLCRRSGSIEYTRKIIYTFFGKAVESISILKDSAAKNTLIQLARYVVSRSVV